MSKNCIYEFPLTEININPSNKITTFTEKKGFYHQKDNFNSFSIIAVNTFGKIYFEKKASKLAKLDLSLPAKISLSVIKTGRFRKL